MYKLTRFTLLALLFTSISLLTIQTANSQPAGPTPNPDWATDSNQAGALMGISVSTAGDVNGDGYDDAIIGSHLYSRGQTREGAAFVYHGSASGLETNWAWAADSNVANAWFGYTVSAAGDVNGDGFGDVIVGAPTYNSDSAAFVYLGSPAGLSPTPDWSVTIPPNVGNHFTVSTAGDVNNDGYDDVILGLPDYWDDIWSGAVFVYHGSATGLSLTEDWFASGEFWYGEFGYDVSPAGDVNGDTYDDILITAPSYGDEFDIGPGAIFVYYGSATGLDTNNFWSVAAPPNIGGQFGRSGDTAGDVNGDTYSDIIIGHSGYNSNGGTAEGAAYVFYGSATGLPATPDWQYKSNQSGISFAYSVSSAGDMNNDGFDEILVAAHNFSGTFNDEGAVLLFYGSASGPAANGSLLGRGNQDTVYFGRSVAPAGDTNNDGYDDALVGAYWYDNGQDNEGAAFAYEGQP